MALSCNNDVKRGQPCPCFTPDFTNDNMLYREIDGLNEVSIAQSKHSLKEICQARLNDVPSVENFGVNDDDVLFDNITPKSMDVSQLLDYAHRCEYEVKHQFDDQKGD